MFEGQYEFKDVGRHKASFVTTIEKEADLFKAVKPFLMSKDIAWMYDIEAEAGEVYAGMRLVGTFERYQPEATVTKDKL